MHVLMINIPTFQSGINDLTSEVEGKKKEISGRWCIGLGLGLGLGCNYSSHPIGPSPYFSLFIISQSSFLIFYLCKIFYWHVSCLLEDGLQH